MIKKSKYLKLNSSNIDKFFKFHLDKKQTLSYTMVEITGLKHHI